MQTASLRHLVQLQSQRLVMMLHPGHHHRLLLSSNDHYRPSEHTAGRRHHQQRCKQCSVWLPAANYPIAYLRAHSLAMSSYLGRSVLYMCAISGTSGSSGFGSVSSEQMDKSTCSSKPESIQLNLAQQLAPQSQLEGCLAEVPARCMLC